MVEKTYFEMGQWKMHIRRIRRYGMGGRRDG